MKRILISVALCLAAVLSAQAGAAPVTPNAMRDANTTITYTNSVLSFLSEWYVTRYMEENSNSYHENIDRSAKDANYHQDEFNSPSQWRTEADLVQQLGGVSPRTPPATIGEENQRFFTAGPPQGKNAPSGGSKPVGRSVGAFLPPSLPIWII